MAAPVLRGVAAPVISTGAVNSPASTEVGDLMIFVVWSQGGAGAPTHTLQSGFFEWTSHEHDDGSTDGRLSVAVQSAASGGTNSYTPYAISGATADGTSIGVYVVQAGTWLSTLTSAAPTLGAASTTNTSAPNPPQVTGLTGDYLVLAIGAWHQSAAANTDANAPANYTMRAENSPGTSHLAHLAICDRTLTGLSGASEDPANITDNIAPQGSVGMTIAIPGAAGTTDAAGTSAGVATVTGTASSTAASSGSSAGVAAVSGTGASTAETAGSSAGVATVTGTAASTAAAVGSSAGVATVTGVAGSPCPVDGPYDLWYTPETADHFTELGLDALDYLWLCEEASGDLAPTIGALTLTTQGTNHLYSQAITGWDRVAVGSTNDNENCAFRTTAGSGPNPAAGSVAWIMLMRFPSDPGATRTNFVVANGGASDHVRLQMNANGTLNLRVSTVETSGTYDYTDGAVHWIVICHNTTASTITVYTDKEKWTGTYAAQLDGTKGLGSTSGGSNGIYRCLWLGAAEGANAERDWQAELLELGAFSTVGTAAGTATVAGVASSIAAATGTISATSSVSGTASATTSSAGSAAGIATATGTGASTCASVGSITGLADALAVGAAFAAAAGSIAGIATVSGDGAATASSVGSIAGLAVVTGVGEEVTGGTTDAVGTASGTSTVTGVGAWTIRSPGRPWYETLRRRPDEPMPDITPSFAEPFSWNKRR